MNERDPQLHPLAPTADKEAQVSTDSAKGQVQRVESMDPMDAIIATVDPTDLTEDLIEDLIDQHPAAIELKQRVKEARNASVTAKGAEIDLVEAAREIRAQLRAEFLGKLGITPETPEERQEREESERLQALAVIRSSLTGKESEDELLTKFGFIDKDGQMSEDSINSPLFHGETKYAFSKYLKFAAEFDAMEKSENETGTYVKGAAEASKLRREAHNVVARLIEKDLGLDYEAARNFVMKMREAIVPNSGEKMSYAMLLRGQKIGERYGHDAAAMTRDKLKGLLPPEKKRH